MAEIIKCKSCDRNINLEIHIVRDAAGNIYCGYCNAEIEKDK